MYVKLCVVLAALVGFGVGDRALAQDQGDSIAVGLLNGEFTNTWYGGWMITDGDANPAFSVSIHNVGDRRYLLLDSLSGYSGQRPEWKPVAALREPALAPNESVVGGLCGRGGELDRRIVAVIIAPPENVEMYTSLRLAWLADLVTRSFDEISTEGIECVNEGFGV